MTLQLSPQGHIVDHTSDIDVGQPVGKLVHVDVVVVDAVVDHRLPLDPRLASPRRESKVVAIISIVSNRQKDEKEIRVWRRRILTLEGSRGRPWRCTQGGGRCWTAGAPPCSGERKQKRCPVLTLDWPPCLQRG